MKREFVVTVSLMRGNASSTQRSIYAARWYVLLFNKVTLDALPPGTRRVFISPLKCDRLFPRCIPTVLAIMKAKCSAIFVAIDVGIIPKGRVRLPIDQENIAAD